jgi:uncharacterized protein
MVRGRAGYSRMLTEDTFSGTRVGSKTDEMSLNEKIKKLQDILTDHHPLLISYSGGVDSALLAVIARETLGKNQVLCIIIDGPGLPRRGLKEAIATAGLYDLLLETVHFDPLSEEIRRKNPPDRCRDCKLAICRILTETAVKHRCRHIADGANASDLTEHRPGIAASSSCGVIHPFVMAGITKADIRAIARMKNLSFWDRPSSACLYSRIPYGESITGLKLCMVERAEDFLHDLGFQQVRVRHHGDSARIEVVPGEMLRIIPLAEEIDREFRAAGFSYVTLDLRGYRSGSMDEVL